MEPVLNEHLASSMISVLCFFVPFLWLSLFCVICVICG